MTHPLCVLFTGLAAACVFASISGAPMTTQPSNTSPVVIGYYAGWNEWYPPRDIRADLLTHVNYAFAVIVNGECTVKDLPQAQATFKELVKLKQQHPHLRTLISIGGWTDSSPFSDAALTDASRARFARSAVRFAADNGFDGVDIDWEYPGGGGNDPKVGRPEDKQNFTKLLAELRRQLDAQGAHDGKRYLLTIAVPASATHYRNIELDRIGASIDFVNLMTYDFAGSWSARTSFNAPLFAPADDPAHETESSADAAVRGYLAGGIPAAKLVLGVPFYGHGWGGVPDVNHGLFQPHDKRDPHLKGGGGYRNLAANYIGKTAQRFWHDTAKVPWLYDAAGKVMITYDDPESLRLKAQYAREHGLAGVMIWELSDDDPQSSLLRALNDGLQRR